LHGSQRVLTPDKVDLVRLLSGEELVLELKLALDVQVDLGELVEVQLSVEGLPV